MNYFFLFYPMLIFFVLGVNYLLNGRLFHLNIIFIALLFSLIVGFRVIDSSTDTAYYGDIFERSTSLEEVVSGRMSWKGDYFFGFITYLIRYFFESYNAYFFLLSLVSVSVLLLGLYRIYINQLNKKKSEYLIYISIFFVTYIPFLIYGNTVRQGLAVSLSVLALSYLKYNPIMYFFLSITAFFTHKSAIILLFFPIYFYFLKNRIANLFTLSLVFLVTIVFLSKMIDYVPYISEKLDFYQSNFQNQTDTIQIIAFLILFVLSLNVKIFSYAVNSNLVYMFVLYVGVIGLALIDAPKIGARLIIYAMPFFPYLILETLMLYKQSNYLIFIFLALIFLSSFYFMLSPQIQSIISYN